MSAVPAGKGKVGIVSRCCLLLFFFLFPPEFILQVRQLLLDCAANRGAVRVMSSILSASQAGGYSTSSSPSAALALQCRCHFIGKCAACGETDRGNYRRCSFLGVECARSRPLFAKRTEFLSSSSSISEHFLLFAYLITRPTLGMSTNTHAAWLFPSSALPISAAAGTDIVSAQNSVPPDFSVNGC